ncbi:MAG TPA: hypothetical protein VEP94_05035 [Solirubrobacterales bacterium]|nr:hypothetical protein [Solirubrobacterales bacterium]
MSTAEGVRAVVIREHYARVMANADAARARAQAAYGIVSAIAIALMAAGLLGGVDTQPPGVQALTVAALVAWLAAAALFLHAVSSPFEINPLPTSSDEALTKAVLDGVRAERAKIDGWQRRAQMVAAVAALLTVAAFLSALYSEDTSGRETALITLTSNGAASMQRTCGSGPSTFSGKVAKADLEGEIVEIELAPGVCGDTSVNVAIPRSAILALAFRGPLSQ